MDTWAVPQLFLHGQQASTARRVKELKAFRRVFVKAGETEECTLTLGTEELSIWDRAMKFTVEPGEFLLFLEEGGARYAQGSFTVLP